MKAIGISLHDLHRFYMLKSSLLGDLILSLVNVSYQVAYISDIPDVSHFVPYVSEVAIYHIEAHEKLDKYLKLGRVIAPTVGYTWLYGFYTRFINFLIGRPSNSAIITRLLFESHLDKKLKSPKFYYDLFFKSKSFNEGLVNSYKLKYEGKKEVREPELV